MTFFWLDSTFSSEFRLNEASKEIWANHCQTELQTVKSTIFVDDCQNSFNKTFDQNLQLYLISALILYYKAYKISKYTVYLIPLTLSYL